MKRIIHTVKPSFLIAVIAAFIVILAIIITLVCVFTIKPGSQQANTTPESAADSQASSDDSNTASANASDSDAPVNTENFIPQSDQVDDSYFSNTLFIGNSITEGFQNFSDLNTPTYYDGRGMTVENIYKMKVVKNDGSNDSEGHGDKTIIDALRDKQYDHIYLLLGANELGWVYPDMFISQYSKLIDTIKELQPNAKICVQSILPVSEQRSETDSVYNNDRINSYNKMIINMANEKGIPYLNAAQALKDENGALPQEETPDGIHLGGDACRKWRDYIKTHVMQ